VTIDPSSPLPVYIQVERLIEQLILKQELSAHELLPGVSVLAKQLSIAPLTVQKAYRRLQDRGLIYAIGGKGTFVADASDQQFVGILVHNRYVLEAAHAPTVALLIQSISEALAELRMPVRILTDTSPRFRSLAPISADVMSILEQGRPLGMILLGHYGSEPLFELARSRSFPVIGLGVTSTRLNAQVSFDHEEMLEAAFTYIRERSITEPAVLWLDQDNSPAESLAHLESVQRVAASCGVKLNPDWIIGVHQATDWAGYHAFNHLLSGSRRPEGLIVTDDVIGRGVHMAVLARQMRVPEDLLVVVQANEDSPIVFPAHWQQGGYNLGECGRIAVKVLQTLLSGEKLDSPPKCPFKWHGEAARSPWNASNVSIRKDGHLGPLFRSGRQILGSVS
jgi:GntR family transcriptional regulator